MRQTSPRPGWWKGDPACWSWTALADGDLDLLQGRIIREQLEWTDEPEPYEDDHLRWIFMRKMHKGRCAICGIRPGRLVTDHDHETGLVRGFLCNTCNGNEARRRYGIYAKYRERTPAMMCGVRQEYSSGWGAMAIVTSPPPEPEQPVRRPAGATDGEVVSTLALAAIWNTEAVTAADCRDYAEGRADLLAQAAEHLVTSWTRWDLAQQIAGVRLLVEAGADESLIDGWPELKALADPAA